MARLVCLFNHRFFSKIAKQKGKSTTDNKYQESQIYTLAAAAPILYISVKVLVVVLPSFFFLFFYSSLYP